jgi:hypothetical protein
MAYRRRLARLSVSILEEGGRLGLKCLLLSSVRIGNNSGVDLQFNHGRFTGLMIRGRSEFDKCISLFSTAENCS